MSNYDKTWTVMNDLEQSFSRVSTIEFLSDKLVEASDNGRYSDVVDISHALLAYIPVYTKDFDEKFKKCWEEVVTPELKGYNQLDKDITGN
tara:strand:- start:3332 stop:3604 length:273 start_codon:yes stop_codon:yes gene_type:complete